MVRTIMCVVAFLTVGLVAAYFNTGFWAAISIGGLFLTLNSLFINFLEKREKKENERKNEMDAASNLRELREKGLPSEVLEELKKSKGLLPTLLPTNECLLPHELRAFYQGKLTEDRMRHIAVCKFCKGLTSKTP